MNKNIIVKIYLVICLLLVLPCGVMAQEALNMVFIQPGGEGSTSEADPLLDRFFAEIKELGGPQIKGAYYADAQAGIQAIKKMPAQIGIVSLNFYNKYKKKLSIEALAATVLRGTGKPFEIYYLWTHKDVSDLKEDGILQIKITGDFEPDFVDGLKSVHTSNPLLTLKKIATQETKEALLLNSFEHTAFAKLKLDWTKNLKLYTQSPKIPSSPVVLFDSIEESTKQNLLKALLKIGETSQGKKMLSELRLEGFALPPKEAY